MDSNEEAGLRAFALAAIYTDGSGAKAETAPLIPRWLERDGMRAEITAIEAEWREEERYGFRVRLANNISALLYYVPELDLWSGAIESGDMTRMPHARSCAG